MGAKDIITKDYIEDCCVFADAFNQYIYKGEQVIKPENLKPLDSVYFSPGEWDGPRSLHEMMAVKDPNILSFVSDYKINLIAPANMTDEELDQFTSSLREVLLFIKYSKDKDRLNEILQTDERFRNVERKAATVISTVTGMKFEVEDEEEENVDMCEALKGLMEDASKDGMQKGMQVMMRRMLKDGSVSVEYIAKMANMTVEEVRNLVAEQ